MKYEWREHLKHDESHFKKWGCIAMGSLTKCGQHNHMEEFSKHIHNQFFLHDSLSKVNFSFC